jgi:hypothetical protein
MNDNVALWLLRYAAGKVPLLEHIAYAFLYAKDLIVLLTVLSSLSVDVMDSTGKWLYLAELLDFCSGSTKLDPPPDFCVDFFSDILSKAR